MTLIGLPASGNIKTSLKKKKELLKHGLESKRRRESGCLAVGDGVGSEGWRGTAGTEEGSVTGWRSHLELWVFRVLSPVICSRWLIND